jgi:hypothetical protein
MESYIKEVTGSYWFISETKFFPRAGKFMSNLRKAKYDPDSEDSQDEDVLPEDEMGLQADENMQVSEDEDENKKASNNEEENFFEEKNQEMEFSE